MWVGQLEDAAASALVRRGAPAHVQLARDAAAGFACVLQALGESLRGHAPQAALDCTASEIRPYFRTWWQRLTSDECALLVACIGNPIAVDGLSDTTRRLGRNALVERGLLTERDGTFVLPGSMWREFVAEQAATRRPV